MEDNEKKSKYVPLMLKPGILVGLKTEVRGGVKYETKPLVVSEEERGRLVDMVETEVVKKEMTKVTTDAEEHKRATQVRNAARARIVGVASATPFGLLCPLSKEPELDGRIKETEATIREFNSTARFSRVEVFILKGYIADDDTKAAQGIASEIADLINKMNMGVELRNPDAIKDAIRKAKAISSMIDDESKVRVSKALEAARASAKDIAKTIATVGNANMVLLTDSNKKILEEMAASFTVLDLDEPVAVEGEALAPVAVVEVDVDPETEVEAAPFPDAGSLDYSDDGEKAAGSPDGEKFNF